MRKRAEAIDMWLEMYDAPACSPSSQEKLKVKVDFDNWSTNWDKTSSSAGTAVSSDPKHTDQEKLKVKVDIDNWSTNWDKTSSSTGAAVSSHPKHTDTKKLKLMVEDFIKHLTNQKERTGSCASTSSSSHLKKTDPEMLWKRLADNEASQIEDKICYLCLCAVRNPEVAFVGKKIQGKLSLLQSYAHDFHSIELPTPCAFGGINLKARAELAALLAGKFAMRKRKPLNPKRPAYTLRGRGIEPIACSGRFAIPKALLLSGNTNLNELNVTLVDTYYKISCILERIHLNSILYMLFKSDRDSTEKFKSACENIEKFEKNLKAAVSVLRTIGFKIRLLIVELGGQPVNEPLAYWREFFHCVQI